ncbi:hypothetical protein [Myxococcus sp. RHSTA-1-4]|uniref:hypothetical protein n=1 Tax=Myxococcus sp. RHSTA-1-4 TaxID=2874601 RepID=UPI001CBE8F19|nr:hypothetical protein [Myxococcus sp. RHSTA-1-4]MBZ4416724.1 hypothetical protein [Myxococcus sp. RHSTA-1-4]
MKRNNILSLLVGVVLAQPVWAQQKYVSASSVEALNGSLSSVQPAVLTPSNAASYLSSSSALGYDGPLGPYGPLGMLGPIGDNMWNPSYWISAIGDWSDWSDDMTDLGGPLSEAGPLGPTGPLSATAYWVDLPAINDFGKQLQAGGVWTVLGPVGPLGALGPLGPLGPVGAHGYATDSDGRYVHNSVEMRTVSVPYSGSTRVYGLYEKYTESYAKTKTDNDTSFMVEGYIAYPYDEIDSYPFYSGESQFVTILLTPLYALDDFDLYVSDQTGQVLAYSSSGPFVDYVQVKVPANTLLVAHVQLYSTGHYLTKDYRLYVTGSTQHINTTDITGNHQVPVYPFP